MKIETGSVKYLVVLVLSISIFGIILFPLLDFVLCKFITNSQFEYSVYEHIIEPILYGIVCGIVFWIADKKKKK